MNPKVVQEASFTVVGISIRTSNAKEATPQGMIGRQWLRLARESVLSRIRNRADKNIMAVYTDYASDHDGEYTYVLGARVTSAEGEPAGLVTTTIPAGRFAVFTSEPGPSEKVVPEVWTKINSLPKTAVGGDRVYKADFEIYDQRAVDPQNSQVDVYVGIK